MHLVPSTLWVTTQLRAALLASLGGALAASGGCPTHSAPGL